MSLKLKIKEISVEYASLIAVDHVSFDLEAGEIGCLIGPSGSGKTSILRAIAGFQKVSSGEIILGNEIITNPSKVKPPEQRGIGIVFQDFALFPHLTVQENILFGIQTKETKEQNLRLEELLTLLKISDFRKHYPHELSGGQQQRVAMGRALAPGPKILLLDEPFSHLDPELRTTLASEVRSLLKGLNVTTLMVTHLQSEAFDLGDKIGVIDQGLMCQWSTPYSVYHQPECRFVADFIGRGEFIEGEVIDKNKVRCELGQVEGRIPVNAKMGENVYVLVRPDDILYDPESDLRFEITERYFRGPYFLYRLRTPLGQPLLSLIPSHFNYEVGQKIGLRLKMDHLICFQKGDSPARRGVRRS